MVTGVIGGKTARTQVANVGDLYTPLVYSSPKSGSLGVQLCPKERDQNSLKTA